MIIKHTLSFLNGLKSVLLVTFILSSPIFNASLVVAQEPDSDGSMKLEPIMVTSTRVLKDLSEVPLSISVIGEKEIEERPLPNTIDYLREMPGVQVSPVLESGGGFRSQYSYSLRGNGPDRTIL
ncbi:MAG: TonB-dependent receptor plug domain-containing protein, partial [Deltaproteobacteria bacterium]|nr:TonB-dependent receptor plug domain-containing protein [Deltaproteobacteria bacterium]